MSAIIKKLLLVFCLTLVSLFAVTTTYAAAPDGAGPWADSVLSSSQGLMKNGSPVPVVRSNPSSAVGVAEDNTTDGNFFSLGFGGNIALGFDNGISSGVIVVEATNPNYPLEKAKVEVSENGTTWVNAGTVTQDGTVNKPESISCAKYVRVTDISDANDFSDATADGYDVDGVKATGDPCVPTTPTPTPTGCPDGCCNTKVTQTNVQVVKTVVVTNSNTGNNKSNGNTGGSNNITTGNATSNSTVNITGGSNIANGGGCCQKGNTNITISGNGNNSKNTVKINSSKTKNK